MNLEVMIFMAEKKLNNTAKLKELLNNVSDSYPDFVSGTALFANKYGVVDDLVMFLQTHKELTTDDVLTQLCDLANLEVKPIEIID